MYCVEFLLLFFKIILLYRTTIPFRPSVFAQKDDEEQMLPVCERRSRHRLIFGSRLYF